MNRKNFLRKKENFNCEMCGTRVEGDGYTDHCPVCLWGKHVDEKIPGDRASDCGGAMKPLRALYEKGKYKIEYKCQKCDHKFRVWATEDDNRNKLVDMVTN